MTALIVFAVGVVIGWIWQTTRDDRLLNKFLLRLLDQTIANPSPPTTIELRDGWSGEGEIEPARQTIGGDV
jgi:hypothetical protein